MYNYEHEIACPEDRAMRKFLWNDYFHDSDILAVKFSDFRANEITLELRSMCDENRAWEKLRGDWETRHAKIAEQADHFTYLLKFSRVGYFDMQRFDASPCDYINARFKDTALLRDLQRETARRLYHLRIQTGSGLMDVVFAGFSIRKKTGRVNYSQAETAGQSFSTGTMIFPSETNEEEMSAMTEEDWEKDTRCCLELEKRYRADDRNLLQEARFHLCEDRGLTDTKLYSAYLLGKVGDSTDIPALMELYFNLEKDSHSRNWALSTTLLPRKNIMDAVELIRQRAEKG